MKISFLIPHIRISGGIKALLEYANRLQNLNHEVQIYLPTNKLKWYQLARKRNQSQSVVHSICSNSIDWFTNHVPINEVSSFNERNLPDSDILVASSWQTALVSPPRKVLALANNLSAVIKDLTLRQRLSENGFRKIQEFDWKTNCKKLEEWFEKDL